MQATCSASLWKLHENMKFRIPKKIISVLFVFSWYRGPILGQKSLSILEKFRVKIFSKCGRTFAYYLLLSELCSPDVKIRKLAQQFFLKLKIYEFASKDIIQNNSKRDDIRMCVCILTLISLLAFSQIFRIAEFDKFLNNFPYIYLREGKGYEIRSNINIFRMLFNYIALITYFCI